MEPRSDALQDQNIPWATPFLKWAGGKSQLLPQFLAYYPAELATGVIKRYVEPFLGGGAVFLDIAQRYGLAECHLFDINEELILAYSAVQREPASLLAQLADRRQRYCALDEAGRAEYFYAVRDRYNVSRRGLDFQTYTPAWIERAADMIFLNKTCFNGLYRVNRAGEFNVPFGRYRNPAIFEERNILRVAELLQNAALHVGGFAGCAPWVDERTFVYFDPPYRPISRTSSFTSYARDRINDDDQRRLARFYAHLSASTGARLMLSNSDPRNLNPNDGFFDDLYAPFTVRRVSANRMINSVAGGRGRISEILVTNY